METQIERASTKYGMVKKLNKIRELHKKEMVFIEIPICRKCYLPRATEDRERVIIDGREIVVKNYKKENRLLESK